MEIYLRGWCFCMPWKRYVPSVQSMVATPVHRCTQIYFDAWSNVQAELVEEDILPSDSAVATLADNWTNSEFLRFVENIATVVDSYDVQPGSARWEQAVRVWQRVVELEAAFWPDDDEDLIMARS